MNNILQNNPTPNDNILGNNTENVGQNPVSKESTVTNDTLKERAKSKNFWILRFGLQSIQGRVTVSFFVMVFTWAILSYLADSIWRKIDVQKDRLINIIQPLREHTLELNQLVKQSQSALQEYFYYKDETLEQNHQHLWLVDIPQHRDFLKGSVYALRPDVQAEDIFNAINAHLTQLQQAQEKLRKRFKLSSEDASIQYEFRTNLYNALQEYEKTTRRLRLYAQEKTTQAQKEIKQIQQQFYVWLTIGFFITILINYIFGVYMLTIIFGWVKDIRNLLDKIAYGNTPDKITIPNNEFRGISIYINQLIDNLTALKSYAEEIGKGNFSMRSKIFGGKSILGKSLNEMGQSLQKVYEQESKRTWTTEGLAQFADIQRQNTHNIHRLCQETISNIVKKLNATQGGFFLVDTHKECFTLMSSYAYGKQKFFTKEISLKEGLLGRAYQEKKYIYLKEIPYNYIELSSGLGSTRPKALVVLPLINDDNEVQGIIELATMHEMLPHELDFLENLARSTASTITMVLASDRNQRLLQESQSITASLKQTEEETRRATIELTYAREELNRKLSESKREFEKLNAVLTHIPEGVIITQENGAIEVFNPSASRMLQYELEEILGRNIRLIFPNDYMLITAQNNHETQGKGVEKVLEVVRKDGSNTQVEASISQLMVNNENIITVIMREM